MCSAAALVLALVACGDDAPSGDAAGLTAANGGGAGVPSNAGGASAGLAGQGGGVATGGRGGQAASGGSGAGGASGEASGGGSAGVGGAGSAGSAGTGASQAGAAGAGGSAAGGGAAGAAAGGGTAGGAGTSGDGGTAGSAGQGGGGAAGQGGGPAEPTLLGELEEEVETTFAQLADPQYAFNLLVLGRDRAWGQVYATSSTGPNKLASWPLEPGPTSTLAFSAIDPSVNALAATPDGNWMAFSARTADFANITDGFGAPVLTVTGLHDVAPLGGVDQPAYCGTYVDKQASVRGTRCFENGKQVFEKEDFDFLAGGPEALYLGLDEATAVLVDRTTGSSQQVASLVTGVRSMAFRKDSYALFRVCPSCGGGTKDGYVEWGKIERTGGTLSLKRERRVKVWTATTDFDRPALVLGSAHVTVFSYARKHGETFRRTDGASLDLHIDRSCSAMNDRYLASAVGRTLFTRKLK